MKRALRVPAAIAFTVVAGTAAGVGVVTALPACEHGRSPTDGQLADTPPDMDGGCELFCIPDPESDAGVCPEPAFCADTFGNCPPGCRPIG